MAIHSIDSATQRNVQFTDIHDMHMPQLHYITHVTEQVMKLNGQYTTPTINPKLNFCATNHTKEVL